MRSPARALQLDNHPIAVVAERTGLTQDVLRVWERRYAAVTPARGPGGQRLYSAGDIERLRLLHEATRGGRSIGQIAQLSLATLVQMVEEDEAARNVRVTSTSGAPDVALLVATGLAFAKASDPVLLDGHLRRALAEIGVPVFLEGVAVPLLRRIGEEWHANRLAIAQEHLVSSIIHDIIVESMRSFAPGDDAPRVLVATLAGERHALGGALVGASAAVQGWRVITLGADLPAEEIVSAAIATRVRVVALSIVHVDDRDRILAEVLAVRAHVPAGVAVIAGGAGASLLGAELSALDIFVGASIRELEDELRRQARRRD